MPSSVTQHRHYPLPHPDNFLSDDVLRIGEAFTHIDRDVSETKNTLTHIDFALNAIDKRILQLKKETSKKSQQDIAQIDNKLEQIRKRLNQVDMEMLKNTNRDHVQEQKIVKNTQRSQLQEKLIAKMNLESFIGLGVVIR